MLQFLNFRINFTNHRQSSTRKLNVEVKKKRTKVKQITGSHIQQQHKQPQNNTTDLKKSAKQKTARKKKTRPLQRKKK
jgi:hypothetical protein